MLARLTLTKRNFVLCGGKESNLCGGKESNLCEGRVSSLCCERESRLGTDMGKEPVSSVG